ncbi:MAG: Ig-like domain-containing protein, partial [Thermoanaerobaculia bacterium]
MFASREWSFGRVLFATGLAVVFAISVIPTIQGQVVPASPRLVDTSFPTMTGTTISVASGGDFQGAIDRALLGDTIVLQAGATYSGTFSLRSKSGSGWIVIRTSAPDSSLPAQGRRITPSYASLMPKIVATNSAPAIQTDAGAHHYRLVGLEITVASSASINYGLVALGTDSQTSTQVPSFLVLDRVYIHGLSGNNLRRGVAFNSATSAVIDSYISEVHEAGADSQAIAGWAGPGPFKIVNNYLSAAGENVLFGGSDPSITNLVPSDIEVRGNHFFKPTSWRGSSWTVKNIFELKNARRVLAEGNIFENNWLAGQNGFSILFTVRNQNGSAPWSVVEEVTFRNNIVRHVAAGVNVLGTDDLRPSQQTKRILVTNNVFDDVSAVNWGGNGRLLQMLDGSADVTFDHNTGFHTGEVIAAAGTAHQRFYYTNNISPNNQYGVAGDNHYGDPLGTLATYFPGAVFRRNVLQGGTASRYPADNFFPASMSGVGFVNLAGGDYHLQSTSPYNNAGTDGKDVGADIDAVSAATAGVLNGTSPGPPPPTDTTPPSVSITAPAGGAALSGTTTVSANASDNNSVAGVQFL